MAVNFLWLIRTTEELRIKWIKMCHSNNQKRDFSNTNLRSKNLVNASTECFSTYHCTNCSFVLTASSGAEWLDRTIIVTQPTRCYKITKTNPHNAHSPVWIHSSIDEATRSYWIMYSGFTSRKLVAYSCTLFPWPHIDNIGLWRG